MKKMMWGPILDFCNESYLIITISIFINMVFWRDHNKSGKMFNLVVTTCLALAIVVGYPLFCLVFFLRKYESLRLKEYREKFGNIYENF